MTARRRISTRERVAIFTAAEGACHICRLVIRPGDAWDVEHVIPLAQGGEDSGDNLRPAHKDCHAAKTAADAGDTARAKRLAAKHIGAAAPSRRGFRAWRNFRGEIVRKTD